MREVLCAGFISDDESGKYKPASRATHLKAHHSTVILLGCSNSRWQSLHLV